MRMRFIPWLIALLLLTVITRNLLAQPPHPEGWLDGYPAPSAQPITEPYPAPPTRGPTTEAYPAPYPWPTVRPPDIIPTCMPQPTIPILAPSISEGPRLLLSEKPKRKSSSKAKPVAEVVVQAAPFVPSPEDVATARRYAEYVEERLLSDAGWWK